MSAVDVCADCGERPARYWSCAELGPVRLGVTPRCEPCHLAYVAATMEDDEPGAWDADAEPTPEEVEEGLLWLGPVDWAALRRHLPAAEAHAPPEVLAWVADAVGRIAAHHGQALPGDVRSFVERHGGPVAPAT